ncbi:MAG: hypothetical protein R3C14_04035 [Caldilineaceae bacterium]
MRTNNQTQQAECASNSPEAGFAPATETNIHRTELKVVGHPAGSPGQYTIESIKAGKTSTDTLGSLLGPALVKKLEARQSPLPTIRVIPLEGALAARLSGAPVLTDDDQLAGMGDGSQAEGLSWLIPWSELHLIQVQEAQAKLDQLRDLAPDDFFLSASADEQAISTDYVVYSGRVFDEQGNFVDRARVVIDLEGESHIVYTDSEGKLAITVVAKQSSRGRIYIQAENYSPLNRLIDLLEAERQVEQFALRSVAPNILYCPFAFRIIDADLKPIRGAHVKVLYSLEFIEDFTNSDGEYRSKLPCDTPNPLVSVEVTAENFASVEKPVKLYPSLVRIQLLPALAAPTTPSSTPALLATAITPTFTPTASPTPQPTATTTPTPAPTYPCQTQVASDEGVNTLSNVIYSEPGGSNTANRYLTVGQTIYVTNKREQNGIWYQFSIQKGNYSGIQVEPKSKRNANVKQRE